MTVTVRLFAALRDAADIEECCIELPSRSRGLDAKAILAERYPRLQGLLGSTRLALNLEYQPWDARLHEGDELSLIPPVSGG